MRAKKLMFEIARWVIVLIAVVHLAVMFGGNTLSTAAPETVAEAVLQSVDTSNMQSGDNQMVKRLYGLDPSAYDGCVLYYPVTNMMAEEMLIVKLKDVSQQEAVRAAAEDRLATQKNTFEGYGVEQFDLLTNYSVIDVRGNYILFMVHKDIAVAQKAFADAL